MSRRTNKEPQSEATRLIQEMGIVRAPVPVEKIARHLGAQVRFSPLDDEISGMIYIKNETPIIGVNSLHHPNRQRFTIAHECGHLVLHRSVLTREIHVDKEFHVLRRDDKTATGTDLLEIQANRFAAELTMPHKFLLEALGNRAIDIDDSSLVKELSHKFKMSEEAMRIRISNLFFIR